MTGSDAPTDAPAAGGSSGGDVADPDALAVAFWSVARQLRHGAQHAWAPFDLSPSHGRALGTLLRHGAVRLGALAEHLGIAPRSATEVVDALEQRGLVAREPDPSDRRATLVHVTDRGRAVMTEARSQRLRESGERFARLDAADRATLARLLQLLGD